MKIFIASFLRIIFFTSTVMFAFDATAYDLIVAQDGSGNYTTVQAAINAAPTGRTSVYTIFIKNGKYKEKVTIPSNKPFLQLIGESVAHVILTNDDYSGKLIPGGGGTTYGTSNSASVTVNAPDFSAFNITFENTTGDAPQAVALNVNADRAVFKNCRFLGGQDTLLTNGTGNRQYFRNCYIDGVVDFIFGGAKAVFDSCVVYPRTRKDNLSGSYITAANTAPGQDYGYVFRNCVIPQNRGITTYVLGRPWQNSCPTPTSFPRTVFLNTTMSSVVKVEGWSTWDACTNTSQIQYAEYQSKYFNGTLLSTSQRVNWSSQLSPSEAANYTNANIFGSWDPCSVYPDLCVSTTAMNAVSNLIATKGASTSSITWNASWGISEVAYELYRSTSQYNGYSKISELVSPSNDTTFNFSLSEANPPSGSIYYYYIKAVKAGYETHTTDTVQVSSAPTIRVTGTLNTFYQTLGSPSPSQSYIVSGTDLQGDVTITPPANYQLSSNNGSNWISTPITFTPTAGTLSNTTILVRLNATTAGTYTGNLVHASTNATTLDIAVNGTAAAAPAITSNVIQRWSLSVNNSDDAVVRSNYVTASTSTLNNLYVSNGTTTPSFPAYSTTYGQAFGPSTNGDGTWTLVGGNLSRNYYEQFTVTANGSSVRVDSILLTSAFYNTNSNTKLGVSFSKTGFTSGITEVSGGVDHNAASVIGSFASPIALANQTGGPTNTYRIAFNGTTGVTLADGETLTIRLYFSCSSTGTPRYAFLKNVVIKGEAIVSLPLQLVSFNATKNGTATKIHWQTANETVVAKFEIQRSANGQTFKAIGVLNAQNINSASYSFVDNDPDEGVNYYRLKMIDVDGTFSYSNIATVAFNNLSLAIFPNPASNELVVNHTKAGRNATVQIFTLTGEQIMVQNVPTSSVQSIISVSHLASGSYLAIYSDGTSRTSAKFIKQ